jgi:hypothetical protein
VFDMGVATNQRGADELCAVLNLAFQLDGAEAEVRAGRYTGRVIMDGASTAQLIKEREILEGRVLELSRELYGAATALPEPVQQMRTAAARAMRQAWGV